MTIQKTITISDYCNDRIFYSYNGNHSARAEELMLKGQDAEEGEDQTIRNRLYNAEKIIKEKDTEIKKLKMEVGRHRANELTDAEKMNEAIKNRGLMG